MVNILEKKGSDKLINKFLNADNKKDKQNHLQLEKYENVKKTIKSYQKFIKENFKFVGENFAYEARSIHYNPKKK